jgi:hypothetical protein
VPQNDTPTLADVILTGIRTGLRNTAVSLPGTVQSYDAASQTCSVKPGVNRMIPSFDDPDQDVSEELPTLQDVPVCWLVGRGIQVKAELQPGDTVLLIAMDRDISGWLRTGVHQDPDDTRIHSWSSAVAIPGLVPSSSPFPEPTDAAALASKLDALIATLKTTAPGAGSNVAALLNVKFPNVTGPTTPDPVTTTGSSVLKLDE